MRTGNPIQDRNHQVTHRDEWHDPPDQEEDDWDLIRRNLDEKVSAEIHSTTTALQEALRNLKDAVLELAKMHDILRSEAEGAAKEWLEDQWIEIFELKGSEDST